MRSGGIGGLQIIPNPTGGITSSGGLMSVFVASATISQQLTNVPAIINFDLDASGNFGYMTRTGNAFNVVVGGTYLAIFEPQVSQQKNNNVTSFWINKNGVAVPNSAAIYEAAAIGDNNVVSLTFSGVLQPGDVLTFSGLTSVVVGSQLLASPAAPPVPSIAAAQVVIQGFRTGTTPTT